MSEFELKCISCKKVHRYTCSCLEWECVESHERGMGTENHYVASWEGFCDCSHSMGIEFHCWEYPTGAINTTDRVIHGAEFIASDCSSCPDIEFDNHKVNWDE